MIALSPALYWNDGAFGNAVAAGVAADTQRERTLFVTSGGLEGPIDSATTTFAAHLRVLLDSTHNATLRFERRRYPKDRHDVTPLPGLIDGLRMAFEPMVVPIDSVFLELTTHHVDDSLVIDQLVYDLESRYSSAANALGIPSPFPERPLDLLGSFSLQVKQIGLARTLFRENLSRYPHSASAHESLGEALVAAADASRAIAELRAAVSLAEAEMRATDSILVWANDRDIIAAARSLLGRMDREM